MGLSSVQVSADALHDWSQDLLKEPSGNQQPQEERQPPLKCPRCESTNTKFCYYNNYSRTQPRHLCKACRRHWTEGGTLRNVPVGGGRKNKRLKTTHTSTATSSATDPYSTSQQQEASLSMFRDHSNDLFPDVLRQVVLHPSESLPSDYGMATNFMGSSLFSTNAPFSSLFSKTPTSMSSYENAVNVPYSTTITSSLPTSLFDVMKPLAEENLKTMKRSSTPSLWQLEPPVAPPFPAVDSSSSSGYWNCWEDDIAEFITPTTENSKI